MCATVTARRRRVTSTRSPREALKRLAPSSAGGTRRRAEGYGHGVRGTFTTRGEKTGRAENAGLALGQASCPPCSLSTSLARLLVQICSARSMRRASTRATAQTSAATGCCCEQHARSPTPRVLLFRRRGRLSARGFPASCARSFSSRCSIRRAHRRRIASAAAGHVAEARHWLCRGRGQAPTTGDGSLSCSIRDLEPEWQGIDGE